MNLLLISGVDDKRDTSNNSTQYRVLRRAGIAGILPAGV